VRTDPLFDRADLGHHIGDRLLGVRHGLSQWAISEEMKQRPSG